MTTEEAIKELSNELRIITDIISYCRNFENYNDMALAYRIKRKEAMETAITALKEIQKYREIGTVQAINQAINILSLPGDKITDIFEELFTYRKIGTVEECQEAMEKQIPKTDKFRLQISGNLHMPCPNCGKCAELHKKGVIYCDNCGQAILDD